jgi:uncharacterized protein (TIGR00369 family)
LHQHLGLRLLEAQDGRSALELPVSSAVANPMNVLHGGILYTVCDVAAYAALVTLLRDDQGAVTHDLHVSCMRPAPFGSLVRVEGQVVKLGRSLAFLDAKATLGDTLIATARVTKSISAAPQP